MERQLEPKRKEESQREMRVSIEGRMKEGTKLRKKKRTWRVLSD